MSQPPVSTLLLRGGHRWVCAAIDAQAVLAYLASPRPDPHRMFALRGPDGQTLTVPAREIVGVVGDDRVAISSVPSALRKDLPGSPYILIDNFLNPTDFECVLSFALAQESAYTTASVTDTATDYRSAQVLFDLSPIVDLFVPRIQSLVPQVSPLLDLPPVAVKNIECQLTAHGTGDYFKKHNDNGSAETANRCMSYVYYVHRSPRGFSGGLLRMFETTVVAGFYTAGEKSQDIEPRANSLIIFPSHCQHEVTAVTCPSGAFADRRFTVNGWVVKGE